MKGKVDLSKMDYTNNTTYTIDLRELWRLFLRKLWIIILVAALVGGGLFAYKYTTYEERYSSTSTVLAFSGSSGVSYNDYMLAEQSLGDFEEIFKSRKVLDQVIHDLDLYNRYKISYKALRSMLSVTQKADTHMLSVTITSPDHLLSKEIVDAVCDVAVQQIPALTGSKTVAVLDKGTTEIYPSNSVDIKLPILGAVAAGIIVFAIAYAVMVSNDKISTPEDIEKYLHLSVLGFVPNKHEKAADKKYRYKGRYYAYGERERSKSKASAKSKK